MPLPVPPGFWPRPQPNDAKWPTPPYAIPTSFTEQPTTFRDLNIEAVVTLPNSTSPSRQVPAVILIAGSGPSDVDGTVGGMKFLRDLAWGFASSGIAVLRWAKDNLHRDEDWFTPKVEYADPVIEARRCIGRENGVDQNKVFLLGHSLGGKALPMIKDEVVKALPGPGGRIAGAIFMAPGYSPLQWSCVRQLQYVNSLPEPGFVKVDGITMGDWVAAARRVDAVTEDESWHAQNLPLGMRQKWWSEVNLMKPLETIQSVLPEGFPMLLLQGDVDYHVTVEDDFRFWRDELKDRKGVEVAVLKGIGHFFTQVHGWATPRDVDSMCHIDGKVIGTLTEWVLENGVNLSGKMRAKV